LSQRSLAPGRPLADEQLRTEGTLASHGGWARAWDLLFALTTRELMLRYRGTVLGYLWWVARPLVLGLVLWFALRKVLDVQVPHYPLFIMTGLFPWFWFSSAVSEASGVMLGHSTMVKKVVFPRAILPLSSAAGNVAQFIFTLPVLLVFLVVGHVHPSPMWLVGIPLLILLQFALTVGIGLTLSVLNVFFRDISPLIDVSMTMLFYGSAVIFPLDRVPHGIRPFLLLNPLTTLMEAWRTVLLDGQLPHRDIFSAVGLAVGGLLAGVTVFRALERYIADAL
jgi:lipopolysaccharide transport system permease protein